MKSVHQMCHSDVKAIKMFVFDVDGVLVPRGTKIVQDGDKLSLHIKRISKENIKLIKQLYHMGYYVNINSGRSLFLLLHMFKDVLPYVSLTYENGSALWFRGEIAQYVNSFTLLEPVKEELLKIKHKDIKGWEPKEFIITIHCNKRVKEIEKTVAKYPNCYCIWNGEAYDIGIAGSQNKGQGLLRTMMTFDCERKNVMVIGDNFNDIEMLKVAGVSVTADKDRVCGQFYTPHNKKLPATILMTKVIGIC